jgi:hypothetical protein
LPSEETKKVKQKETKTVEQKETKKVKSKQINKIEPTNKINLLEQTKLWHQRMGHINPISLKKTLGLQSDIPLDECEICIESKLTNQRNKEITPKAKVHLEKVVTDLCGPISPQTINGERYIIFFLDSATRYLEFKLLKSKSEAYEAFIEFKNRAENLSKRKIQYLKSDQGGEFVNKRFKGACFTYGIVQQYSAAYTHEQNGLIERINRTILEKVRCILFTAKLLKYF